MPPMPSLGLLFDKKGIGFGDEATYDIVLRVLDLAKTLGNDLTKLRFWGKILGTQHEYKLQILLVPISARCHRNIHCSMTSYYLGDMSPQNYAAENKEKVQLFSTFQCSDILALNSLVKA